jgi:hypothetical protein
LWLGTSVFQPAPFPSSVLSPCNIQNRNQFLVLLATPRHTNSFLGLSYSPSCPTYTVDVDPVVVVELMPPLYSFQPPPQPGPEPQPVLYEVNCFSAPTAV